MMPWRRCRGEDAVEKMPWDAVDRCRIWMKPWTHPLQLGQIDDEKGGRIPGRVECLYSSYDYFCWCCITSLLGVIVCYEETREKGPIPGFGS
jgi:hypothetical protein